ncbi:hypothetical protein [Asticcacaulis sp. 201]|uniref:hypothetical protein n=1 Tax=Asticcacaulis sp. 201 TaxID=3028787 RepID=UPI002916ED92|nr:hypothetical protein [Asticcacaulis sp. 201]MDV6330748.1 hypothetical protein [Asticcacaulis sp. 201]
MLRRHILLSSLAIALSPCVAKAEPQDLPRLVPNVGKVGTGRLSVLMVPVLDLTLYGPGGTWSDERPFALHIEHLRHLDSQGTSRRIISEIRALGFHDEARLAAWQHELMAILPDIKTGDTSTLVRTSTGATAFYHRNRFIGQIAEPAFSANFFAICLSPKTTQPALRRSLLGEA